MRKSISWMAKNHVAANLLMMIFIVGGLMLGFNIKQEVFPEIQLDQITVTVAYPGASPEEVEEGIVLKIEESISGVDGVKEIKAVAAEGFANVTAVLETGVNADRVLQDIKSEVDRIITFPDEAEKPITSKVIRTQQVISVVIYGKAPERSIREQAESIRDDLLAMEQITQVDLSGVRPYEISIEISEENLRRYNLTLDKVANLVRRASLDIPGGLVKAEGGEILIRTKEQRYTGSEYEDIIIAVKTDGTTLRLKDIANVKDYFEETDTFARFDGKPAAMIVVYRTGDQKPLEISNIVKGYVEKKKETLPESLQIKTWNDRSEILWSRISLLLKNAFLGLILVFCILSLFLHMKLALWVMLGIPVSFCGALLIMPGIDVSINMISLFAFIMALGIVVDDAIVIGENIYEHRQKEKSFTQAAIDGAREVGIPVIFSVLTSIAAFVPLIYVTGSMGKFIKVIPLVVISILTVSLIESLFVLPAHLSFGEKSDKLKKKTGHLELFREKFITKLENFISGPYARLLNNCMKYRYVTIATAISILFITIGLVKGGIVKFRFMPEVDGDTVRVDLRLPQGALIKDTKNVHDYIVRVGHETVEEIDKKLKSGKSILRDFYSVVGGTIERRGPVSSVSGSSPNISNISMLLQPSEERTIKAAEVARNWRNKLLELPGVESLTVESNLFRLGANIDIRFAHEDYQVLTAAMMRMKETLRKYPGVTDISDNYPHGKRELKLKLNPAARILGITEEDLGRQLRSAFYGAEALRLQRGRNEVKVMVRYPEDERKSLWNLKRMWIRSPSGVEIPINEAAAIIEGRSYSEINRSDRKRVINVTASVDPKIANAEEIIGDLKNTILKELKNTYQGLTYDLEGEDKERRESLGSMLQGFLLALFVIYALLAIPFRSYTQPLIIMVAIPFGMVGAVFGHLLLFKNLSILSIFGIVALSGVVVNDSLLLIDQANRNIKDGYKLFDAISEAGKRRFRPILLTSLTTFFGLVPMISETSVQAQFLIPMAISLAFGIMFATAITLLLIPSLYLALQDVRRLLKLSPINSQASNVE